MHIESPPLCRAAIRVGDRLAATKTPVARTLAAAGVRLLSHRQGAHGAACHYVAFTVPGNVPSACLWSRAAIGGRRILNW